MKTVTVISTENDTLEAVAWRHLGTTNSVATIITLNPDIRRVGPILDAGTPVVLPFDEQPVVTELINLWN